MLDVRHHEVFSLFKCWEGSVDAGFQPDFLGVMTRESFFSIMGHHPEPRQVETQLPAFDEEYFEWIDLLESIQQAKGEFTLIELGAGYGRWLVRAAIALRQYNDIPCLLVGVEAEPKHFDWMQLHFRDNGLDPDHHQLIRAAVSDNDGEVWFYIGLPNDWYGQSIAARAPPAAAGASSLPKGMRRVLLDSVRRIVPGLLRQRAATPPQVVRAPELDQYISGLSNGQQTEGFMQKVRAVSLKTLLDPLDHVDLIDLDVQGAELTVLRAAAPELDRKVRRVHIGTHSVEIENGLREVFGNLGWIKLNDYSLQAERDTPYGPITFGDGVQTWTNPRL